MLSNMFKYYLCNQSRQGIEALFTLQTCRAGLTLYVSRMQDLRLVHGSSIIAII